MGKTTTSSSQDDRAPSTPEEKAAAAAYGKKLDAELDAEFAKEDGDNAPESKEEEPVEKPDSENEPAQEQDKSEVEESTEDQTSEETVESEKESEPIPEDPKEKRYREQLAGERKANAELQARLQALEAKIVSPPQQQKEKTPEEVQFAEEKKLLREKYGLIDKDEVQALLDARLKPVQKKREDVIFQNIYTKFPDVSPDKDPTNEKWEKVSQLVKRFMPSNPTDPLEDFEERFEWAYEKTFNKKAPNAAQARQTSYAGVGGGSSAAKSRTTARDDKYAHLSPTARAYKAQLDSYFAEEEREEEARKKRK